MITISVLRIGYKSDPNMTKEYFLFTMKDVAERTLDLLIKYGNPSFTYSLEDAPLVIQTTCPSCNCTLEVTEVIRHGYPCPE